MVFKVSWKCTFDYLKKGLNTCFCDLWRPHRSSAQPEICEKKNLWPLVPTYVRKIDVHLYNFLYLSCSFFNENTWPFLVYTLLDIHCVGNVVNIYFQCRPVLCLLYLCFLVWVVSEVWAVIMRVKVRDGTRCQDAFCAYWWASIIKVFLPWNWLTKLNQPEWQ